MTRIKATRLFSSGLRLCVLSESGLVDLSESGLILYSDSGVICSFCSSLPNLY